MAGTKTKKTMTVVCVMTFSRDSSTLLMQTNLRWFFLCGGGLVLSRGKEIVYDTSSSMRVVLAAGKQ